MQDSQIQLADGGANPTSPLHLPAKAHQRIIREKHALEHDPLINEKRAAASSFRNAWVREVDNETAKTIILKYEWLGTMGTTDHRFGLYFGDYLAGVVCFGRTAGTKTAASICGPQYAGLVRTLNRGACVHWAPRPSASFLINRACRLMSEKGFYVFIAYSDPEAGEVGTVYQAANWLYCGTTGAGSSMFIWAGKPVKPTALHGRTGIERRILECKDGKPRDERNIQHMIRIRAKVESYATLCTRRELKERLVAEGFVFYKTQAKHRYLNLVGDKATVTELRAALRWSVFPYPKRRATQVLGLQ